MIVAKRKPFEEIKEMIKDYKKVLNVGCGTCVAVCLAGGEKEVAVLNAEIDMARKLDNNPIELGAQTVERQCDHEYLEELDSIIGEYDADYIYGMRRWEFSSWRNDFRIFRSFRVWILPVCLPIRRWGGMKSVAVPAANACSE